MGNCGWHRLSIEEFGSSSTVAIDMTYVLILPRASRHSRWRRGPIAITLGLLCVHELLILGPDVLFPGPYILSGFNAHF